MNTKKIGIIIKFKNGVKKVSRLKDIIKKEVNSRLNPRYNEFKSIVFSLEPDSAKNTLNCYLVNISKSGVFIEFNKSDIGKIPADDKLINHSFYIMIQYPDGYVREKVTIIRRGKRLGAPALGCRFDDENTDPKIIQARMKFINSITQPN